MKLVFGSGKTPLTQATYIHHYFGRINNKKLTNDIAAALLDENHELWCDRIIIISSKNAGALGYPESDARGSIDLDNESVIELCLTADDAVMPTHKKKEYFHRKNRMKWIEETLEGDEKETAIQQLDNNMKVKPVNVKQPAKELTPAQKAEKEAAIAKVKEENAAALEKQQAEEQAKIEEENAAALEKQQAEEQAKEDVSFESPEEIIANEILDDPVLEAAKEEAAESLALEGQVVVKTEPDGSIEVNPDTTPEIDATLDTAEKVEELLPAEGLAESDNLDNGNVEVKDEDAEEKIEASDVGALEEELPLDSKDENVTSESNEDTDPEISTEATDESPDLSDDGAEGGS